MNSQILKKTMLRNLAMSAVMLLALAGAARAQDSGIQASGPNGMLQAKDAADQKSIKEYINRRENDAKYQETIHEQKSAPSSNDPWGSVRPTTPTTPGAKSAAKPATKSASSTTKPAKPAMGATPNGQ